MGDPRDQQASLLRQVKSLKVGDLVEISWLLTPDVEVPAKGYVGKPWDGQTLSFRSKAYMTPGFMLNREGLLLFHTAGVRKSGLLSGVKILKRGNRMASDKMTKKKIEQLLSAANLKALTVAVAPNGAGFVSFGSNAYDGAGIQAEKDAKAFAAVLKKQGIDSKVEDISMTTKWKVKWTKLPKQSSTLYGQLQKLARDVPSTRKHLIPLLRKHAADSWVAYAEDEDGYMVGFTVGSKGLVSKATKDWGRKDLDTSTLPRNKAEQEMKPHKPGALWFSRLPSADKKKLGSFLAEIAKGKSAAAPENIMTPGRASSHPEVKQFLAQMEAAFKRHFPQGFWHARAEEKFGHNSIYIAAATLPKGQQSGGYLQNDPSYNTFWMHDSYDAEGMKDRIKIEISEGGSLWGPNSSGRQKVGWRNGTGKPEGAVRKFDRYFGKLKQMVDAQG